MLIVMRTWSTSDIDNENYDYAIFKMERAEAAILAQRLNLYKVMQDSDEDLAEMIFSVWSNPELACEFFSTGIWEKPTGHNGEPEDHLPAEIQQGLLKQGWAAVERLDPDITPKDAHCPSHLDLVLCKKGFFWRAIPQESSLRIDTEVLPRELLSRVL